MLLKSKHLVVFIELDKINLLKSKDSFVKIQLKKKFLHYKQKN